MPQDNFFHEVGNTKPFFKAMIDGFSGSGKTFTATLLAIGLHQRLKSTKPIVMFDTEKASKFLKPLYDKAGIRLLVREGKSLADLKETMRRIKEENLSDILVCDSITHLWDDFMQAYAKKVNRTRLQFQDWAILKPAWLNEFTTPYINGEYHSIVCGRAAVDYAHERNEETGKMEMFKSGVKMRGAGEAAYESDLFIYMEREEDLLNKNKKVNRTATILKDRSNLIDGKTFTNPTYEYFAPVIEALLTNPVKIVTEAERDATILFKTEEEKREWRSRKEIALEEIENYLVSLWPGRSAEENKMKVDALNFAFETMSWKAVEIMPLEKIENGLIKIKEFGAKFVEDKKKETEKELKGKNNKK